MRNNILPHTELTEERIMYLVDLATEYAILRNLDVDCYIQSMLNPDNLGNHDAGQIVELLIKYTKEWLNRN
jgi:hypothetical protein